MLTPADLERLIARVAARDDTAFAELYQATHLKLFGICLRILRRKELAEEILQEVYIRIWDRAGDFKKGRASPITWMATIARNRALDEVRKRKPEFADDMSGTENISDPGASPARQAEINEELRRLEDCLGKLEPEHRDAVRLAYLDGLSRAQLAERFSKPVGTVKTWLRRSLQQLKDCLET